MYIEIQPNIQRGLDANKSILNFLSFFIQNYGLFGKKKRLPNN